jgi:hypothetical protein
VRRTSRGAVAVADTIAPALWDQRSQKSYCIFCSRGFTYDPARKKALDLAKGDDRCNALLGSVFIVVESSWALWFDVALASPFVP